MTAMLASAFAPRVGAARARELAANVVQVAVLLDACGDVMPIAEVVRIVLVGRRMRWPRTIWSTLTNGDIRALAASAAQLWPRARSSLSLAVGQLS